ncbi:MAG: hydantoinase/oxoprolinase family protein [Pelagimonas sp.]|uniref:hydantoinase/oxoprolinase family protein n=1 Tax=Pelagimonas sp. TaxID=2073170 RepID=UPI003D6A139C
MRSTIAVDIGGTFTDVAAFEPGTGAIRFEKTASTPAPDEGAIEGLRRLAASGFDVAGAELLKHGTTVVINSILERKGAKAALVTTQGFRDTLEIGRGNRPESFNLMYARSPSFIPRDLRFEVPERILASGEVARPLDLDALAAVVDQIKALEVEAVAVSFLHAYRNPEHERMAAAYIGEHTGCFVTASHALSGEFREYERSSTAAINAFVGPKAGSYIDRFRLGTRSGGFEGNVFLMGSAGGMLTVETASECPILLIESGPVGGAAGAAEIGRLTGNPNVIAFDMGGTTAKTVMIEDGIAATTPIYYAGGYERGHPVQAAVLDIVEVGAGGGSIAHSNAVGSLEVGPQSAGSFPGPACYGNGGNNPTVTDANLYLGRLNAENFLGGEMQLDEAASRRVIEELADELGQSPQSIAVGILRLATLKMASSVRMATLEKGIDPQDFAMVAYGGAGPLHASAVARQMGISRVIIPPHPGHFCAFGMLFADLQNDLSETIGKPLTQIHASDLEARLLALATQGEKSIRSAGSVLHGTKAEWYADMRYQNQEHTIKIRLDQSIAALEPDQLRVGFEAAYQKRYGRSVPSLAVDLVNIRVTIKGIGPKPEFSKLSSRAETSSSVYRDVYFGEGFVPTRIVPRASIAPGQIVEGPAIIEEGASTNVINPDDSAQVDEYGNLLIKIGR